MRIKGEKIEEEKEDWEILRKKLEEMDGEDPHWQLIDMNVLEKEEIELIEEIYKLLVQSEEISQEAVKNAEEEINNYRKRINEFCKENPEICQRAKNYLADRLNECKDRRIRMIITKFNLAAFLLNKLLRKYFERQIKRRKE